MPKEKIAYICANCSFQSLRWQGKCPECGEWNSFEQRKISGSSKGKTGFSGSAIGKVVSLSEVGDLKFDRISSGVAELDMVLGGGIVPGSLLLLGGDPGIGKSTLALQVALNMGSNNQKVLYISGEESPQQLKMRSRRIPSGADIEIMGETNLETILDTLVSVKPDLAIIDSIQTLNSSEVGGVVGGVSQLSYCTNALMRVTKENHIAVLLIGHVTKEGMLAGPKTIEHMVDTVLYLEGDRFMSLRLLRSSKNRFGSVGEVGVFEMTNEGLIEVANPSLMFLENRGSALPGSCIAAVLEGNKTLFLEVQALTNPSSFGYPKRATSGFDVNRLQLLLAILQKSLKLELNTQDVYINVAGGFKIQERAADLPVVLAILSSFKNRALPEDLVAFGEIGLLGELRGVAQADKRLREAEKLSFKNVIVGGLAKSKLKSNSASFVSRLQELVRFLE
jgi:DNA repair protein RadA/Sms